MRYFQPPSDTRFYAGVDLNARSLFLVVLDHHGQTRYARNLPAAPEPFRKAIAPFRDRLVVGCECMYCGYWLADTYREDNIAFLLGHAWGMKAVHGSKTKCDRKDAEAIARLLKGGNFPLAYAYPKERRGLRDLLRARLRLVRQRAELYGRGRTFNVNLEGNVFHCFDKQCAHKGDGIDLWAALHGLSLREAALDLVRTFGLESCPPPATEKRNG